MYVDYLVLATWLVCILLKFVDKHRVCLNLSLFPYGFCQQLYIFIFNRLCQENPLAHRDNYKNFLQVMSETDDTDELLLIPPDFFLNKSELEYSGLSSFGPYYNVVDGLITQVNTLEGRINFIENSPSLTNNSFESDSNMYKNTVPGLKKYNSTEDLPYERKQMYSNSAQNTPQKPRTIYTLNSLPNTPNVNRFIPRESTFNARKSPHRLNVPKKADSKKSGGNNEILGEIDNFLSHVKTIKKLNAVRNLESDFNKSADINRVDQMLKDMDLQHQKLEERIKNNEQQVFHSPEKLATKEKTWQCGDDVNTVPDYGFGMRNTMYSDNLIKHPIVHETFSKSTASSSQHQLPSSHDSSIDSSDSTQMTVCQRYKFTEPLNNPVSDIHLNALNVLNRHKNLLGADESKSKKGTDPGDLRLVSLSNLWNTNSELQNETVSSKLKYQLHEEKLRRQHCEEIIHKLQNRNLELQERLAVAVKVDEAKDNAILQFHDSWENMALKVQELNKEKLELEQEIHRQQAKNSKDFEDASQKIAHYENEASKALNLAHNSQEKLSYLEKHCAELQEQVECIKRKCEELQKNYENEIEKNKQFPEIIAQKEIELNENKVLLTEAKNEITQSKKTVDFCQNELISIRTEYAELELNLQNEKKRVLELNEREKKLVNETAVHKEKQETLQKQINEITGNIENTREYLKGFYQDQMEIVVKDKVSKLQDQLDVALITIKDNLKKKEFAIAKNAAAHIQQISEKCAEEIRLLEQRHQEENRLHQIELSQYQQQIDDINLKFQKQQEKRAHIDRQLIKFMESLQQDQSFNSVDQLNSFKTKSYMNLEEILSQNGLDEQSDGYVHLKTMEKSGEGDGQSTYRVPMQLPVTSKRQKSKQSEHELQKFIHMVYKPPSSSGVMTLINENTKNPVNLYSDKSSWQSLGINDGTAQSSKSSQKEKKYEKPPWK